MNTAQTFARTSDTSSAADAPTPLSSYRWYVLAVLVLVYACHYLDRTVVSVVLEAVKQEFSLSDGQLGLLSGLIYGISFAIAGIPLGVLIDRVNRKKLLSGLLLIWSLLTTLSGLAQSFVNLLLARVGVGAAEAGGSPTAMSIISDTFPRHERATAMGIFFLSGPIGFVASFALGGWIVAEYGWRAAFFAAGIPGILLAVLIFTTVREPARGAYDPETAHQQNSAPTYAETLKLIVRRRSLLFLMLAALFSSSVQASFLAWVVPFFMRLHDMNVTEAGTNVALAIGVFGAISTPFAGWLADRIGKRDPRRMLWFVGTATALVVPVGLALVLTPSTSAAVVLLMLMNVLMQMWLGASYGLTLSLAPSRMRGMSTATLQVANNLIGAGLAPFLVGVLSDWYGGSDSLRWALATLLIVDLAAAACYFLATRTLRSDLQQFSVS
ncbi:MAG: MFS transporter [Steroidobacteraceae bacterium]